MDARAPIAVLWAMRAVVLTVGEEDPNVIAGCRALGADTVVTTARPSLAAARLAEAAGLRYIPFLSTRDVDRLLTDSEYRAEVRAIPGIAGFHYMNDQIVEGYTSAFEQERAYTILKSLFPAAIVIHPTRLDLLATDATFADLYVRPEFTDYVAPYFYPVASTVLGPQQEDDPWEERLAYLLGLLQPRIPSGKPVLPVLQAFEQDGYPVGPDLASRQLDVYRRVLAGHREPRGVLVGRRHGAAAGPGRASGAAVGDPPALRGPAAEARAASGAGAAARRRRADYLFAPVPFRLASMSSRLLRFVSMMTPVRSAAC